ncbi:MAG: glycosyltransferase family 2 protein [Ignavibacteriae bacterium]|nr:glycosyltransferase family 2 protein [Ignavibacteriota bacterium]
MKISIIIVNYNTSEYLKNCIDSVNRFEKDFELEFIIVDNHSEDRNYLKELPEERENVRIIYLDSNTGFAFANNKGFEASSGEYILILNPDIEFTESMFGHLIEKLTETNAGAIGVRLCGMDGKLQEKYYQKYPNFYQYFFFYSVFSKPFAKSVNLRNKYLNFKISDETENPQKVSQIPGAFIFLKREVYEEAGGFDESYFLFFEDVDLCYRIAKKRDLYIASAKVRHIGASSMKLKTNYRIYGYFIVSFVNFYRKNYSTFSYLFLKCCVFNNSVSKILIENSRRIFGSYKKGVVKAHKYIIKHF